MGGDEALSKRDLSEHPIAYLYVDGIAERLRPGQKREAVLAVWGHRRRWMQGPAGGDGRFEGGRRDRAGLLPGPASTSLGGPLLVVSDGAARIIRAIEECFPRSARQRCQAPCLHNLGIKVSADLWPEFKARVTAS